MPTQSTTQTGFQYDTPEMARLIESRVLKIGDHQYLDSRLTAYVRCEPHERTLFETVEFKHVWCTRYPGWDWNKKPPQPKDHPEYHLVQKAVRLYFHEKGRLRTGTFDLPPEVRSREWTAINVAGWLYGPEVKELVRQVTGLVPGRRDGFLAEFLKARKSLYNRLSVQEKEGLHAIAMKWNRLGPPMYIKKKQFETRFHRIASAFTSMCLKELGIWPFIFYAGLPGSGIPVNVFEAMQVKSIARQGLKEWMHIDFVLDHIHDYVFQSAAILNKNPELVQPARRKAKENYLASDLYSIHQAEDIRGSRLELHFDKFKGDLGNYNHCKLLLWQFVACSHSLNTNNPDVPPPWQALSTRLHDLLLDECIPADQDIKFGYNVGHTSKHSACTFLQHWFDIGFLEFKAVWRNGQVREKAAPSDCWPQLAADGEEVEVQAQLDEALNASEGGQASSQTRAVMRFGSGGQLLNIALDDTTLPELGQDVELLPIADPGDDWQADLPPHDPSNPIWTPPSIVPNSSWARGQYIHALSKEVGGFEMDIIFKTCMELVQCPMDANFALPLKAFAMSPALPTPPQCSMWNTDRAYLLDNEELVEIESFLRRKPWTLSFQQEELFGGYSISWTSILASTLYARARAHKEVLQRSQPPHWARSGQDSCHQRAIALEFSLSSNELISLLHDFRDVLRRVYRRASYPGLPPSLVYARFDTRIEYLRSMLHGQLELVSLLKTVQKLPQGPALLSLPSYCKDIKTFLERSEDTGSLWNFPRCGTSSDLHLATDPENAVNSIINWWSRDDLFIDQATGHTQSLETGLSHMLQIALIIKDLDHVQESRADGAAMLAKSALHRPAAISDLLHRIAETAVVHISQLRNCIEAQVDRHAEDAEGTIATSFVYDEYPITLSQTVERHQEQLQEEQDEAEPYLRTINQTLALNAYEEDRVSDLVAARQEQNKINRQRTGAIHPLRKTIEPSDIPDLSFVDAVELPMIEPSNPQKTRAKRTAPRVAMGLTSINSIPVSTSLDTPPDSVRPGGRKRKNQTLSSQGPVKRKRVYKPTTKSIDRDIEDVESAYHDSGDENVSDTNFTGNVHVQGRGRAPNTRGPRRAGKNLQFMDSSSSGGLQAQKRHPPGKHGGMTTYMTSTLAPVQFTTLSDTDEEAVDTTADKPRRTTRPRPVPRRKGAPSLTTSGISTAF